MSERNLQEALDQVAALEAKLDEMTLSIDLCFIVIAGVICFLLQAGFGLLEVGGVRAKNASNIMLKNVMDAAVGAIAYYVFGYSLAYGPDGNSFVGGSGLMVLAAGGDAGSADYIYWFFNYVFAGTTATIVSGAVAERCQFRAYLVYSFILTAFIYPIASHWIWDGSGFLNGKVYDFAGGGAVHMVGGAAAAAGSIILGPRKGKFVVDEETGKKVPVKIPGHNMVFQSLGALILWFGFFAFNGGSTYAIAGEEAFKMTGRAVVVTTLGGATGSCTLLALSYMLEGTWDLGFVINGLLGGMVATCSGANALEPWGGVVMGFFGALATQGQVALFENVLFIDDPICASAVHFGAGAAGMIGVALLGNPDYAGEDFTGLFYGGGAEFLGYQFMGMAAYTGWAFGTSAIMFGLLSAMGWFRVDEAEEDSGMDVSHHGGKAYTMDDGKTDESA